jgi:hypothetical protein
MIYKSDTAVSAAEPKHLISTSHIYTSTLTILSSHLFTIADMLSTAATAAAAATFLFGSAYSAAVLVHGEHYNRSSVPIRSGDFIVHSRHSNASGFDDSLGYLTAGYSYALGWDAILDANKSYANTCYISDITNVSNASLEFSGGGDNKKGVLLTPRSEKWPNGRITMLSRQYST